MVNYAGLIFLAEALQREDVKGKRVLDVGSFDARLCVRRFVGQFSPSEYVGVDLKPGPGVDRVMHVDDGSLLAEFGPCSFDVVVSTEVIEHTKDWVTVVTDMKRVCKEGGILVITTRSSGFPFHAFPRDYWRYEWEDMESIFSDCEVMILEKDWERPGIFVKVRVPAGLMPKAFSEYPLYSMVAGKRVGVLDGRGETLEYKMNMGRSKVRDFIYKWGHWAIEHI